MSVKFRSLVLMSLMILGFGRYAVAATSGSLTVTGAEQPGDSGTITVAFDGYSESVGYGAYSSATSIASALGAMFSRDFTASLCVHATGTTISFTSKTGAALGPIHVTGSTTSFQIITSGWPSGLPSAAVTLSSSSVSVTTNTTVTFTATVTSGATGTVTFYDGDTAIGTSVISGTTASLATGELAIGIHTITALYSGDTNYSSEVSSPITETISLAPEACTISALDLNTFPQVKGGPSRRWRTGMLDVGYRGAPQPINSTTCL